MVIDHINHALHAEGMNGVHQLAEVLHCAVAGVDGAVIPVGIRAAQAAFFVFYPDRVNRHEPDDVRAEGFDALEIRDDGEKSALFRVAADVDAVEDAVTKGNIGVRCHGFLLLLVTSYVAISSLQATRETT